MLPPSDIQCSELIDIDQYQMYLGKLKSLENSFGAEIWRGQALIGWGHAQKDAEWDRVARTHLWSIQHLHVEEEFRGKGFGQWLILGIQEAIHQGRSRDEILAPADWGCRNTPSYLYGQCGTSEAALRAWEAVGLDRRLQVTTSSHPRKVE